MLKHLVEQYIWLLNYCNSPEYEPLLFKAKHDEYAKPYSKMSLEDSGEVTHEILQQLGPVIGSSF